MMNPLFNRRKFIGPENFGEDPNELVYQSSILREQSPDWEKRIDAALSDLVAGNKELLIQEMAEVLQGVAARIKDLELSAEIRRQKHSQRLTGDFNEFRRSEINFQKDLDCCRDMLNNYIKCFGILPNLKQEKRYHAKDLYNRIDKFFVITKGQHITEKHKELSFCVGQIMIRFAGVCESEQVKHNLPVHIIDKAVGNITPPELPPSPAAITRKKPNKSEHIIRKQISAKPKIKERIQIDSGGDFKSDLELCDKELSKECIETPTAFIEEYCKMNGLLPEYDDLGVLKTTWNNEHIYTCKVLKYTGEGRGKKRATAKQCAAANLIKVIAARQRRGKLLEELKPLSVDQLEFAIMLMSEYLPFDEELFTLSQEQYQRTPIYAPILNMPGNYIRCKALGQNAVGYGKTKEIAKRMAAKFILDKFQDIKEQKKKDQKLKLSIKSENSVDK